ncbi:MAG: adenosylhomocysteinase, partial [Candidatus Omnitrophica bacterium]|nr:adenosylhomocysteinase [Candidatus Omnitrophota bacterium]
MKFDYEIKDINLATKGKLLSEWAANQMPVLASIRENFSKNKVLTGLRIGACLHITTETANLAITLKMAGAEVYLCASNPLSTNDSVAAFLVKNRIHVFAHRGENARDYYSHIKKVLSYRPQLLMDDGADLVSTAHKEEKINIIGGTEETTTGIHRLRSLEKNGLLRFPVIAVNDANTKHLFDNRYGTGQSTIDGLLRTTNILIAGKTFVVCGYGWCGRGVALRAKGMGANVIVTEVDPLRALEAVMDGYRVMPIKEASKTGNVFITTTGDKNVIRKEHFKVMKEGAILGNSGHFNVEIDIPALENLSQGKTRIREQVEEYRISKNRRLYLLAEGRLLNLAGAEGHPPTVMDMSFAN